MSTFAKALKRQKKRTKKKEQHAITELFTPRDYQQDAINWIIDRVINGLFLAPGLGKTAIVLSAFKLLRHADKVDKLFIVAPLRVCHLVWPKEIKKWGFNFTIGILHGGNKDKELLRDYDIYIINPEGLRWFSSQFTRKKLENWFRHKVWLVVDESSKFRNGRSVRFKTLKSLLKYFNRRTILTGSPAPNGLEGLWGQLFILDRGERLGEFITAYRNRFFYPSGYMGYTYLPQVGAEEKIYAAIDDIIMHKGREELDLPPLVPNIIDIELPPDARTIYDDMMNEFLALIEEVGIVVAVTGAVATGKLRQISSGGVYDENHNAIHIHNTKIEALEELVEELEGHPIMVFYEFNHDLERLQKAFPKAKRFGVSTKSDVQVEREWNNDELQMLLLHPASAGHGLNLQESSCRDICWITLPWDLELYEQGYSRIWRSGVEESVTMHHLLSVDTLDATVMNALLKKEKVQNALMAALSK